MEGNWLRTRESSSTPASIANFPFFLVVKHRRELELGIFEFRPFFARRNPPPRLAVRIGNEYC